MNQVKFDIEIDSLSIFIRTNFIRMLNPADMVAAQTSLLTNNVDFHEKNQYNYYLLI